jgi:hypothetical protein
MMPDLDPGLLTPYIVSIPAPRLGNSGLHQVGAEK